MKKRGFWRQWILSFPVVVAAVTTVGSPVARGQAALYRTGDLVEESVLRERGTGRDVKLSDLAGRILVLDWFAWWCPFCQAAAPQLLTGVRDHYEARGGNPGGVPVLHVGVNLQSGQEAQTGNFVQRAGYDLVLEDFSRKVAGRIASGGQPLFAIINGVTNSPSHRPWELLYSRAGYGQTIFPVEEFRAAIDAVLPPPPELPPAPTLSRPRWAGDGRFVFQLLGRPGRSYRVETSADLALWSPVRTVTATMESESIEIPVADGEPQRFVRVVAL